MRTKGRGSKQSSSSGHGCLQPNGANKHEGFRDSEFRVSGFKVLCDEANLSFSECGFGLGIISIRIFFRFIFICVPYAEADPSKSCRQNLSAFGQDIALHIKRALSLQAES